MVRNYVRKSNRCVNYTRAQLREAVAKVRSGESNCYEAAARYNIPRTTLHGHVVGKHTKSHTLGKPPALSADVESKLAVNLLELENGFNLTRKETLELVGLYLRSNNIKNPFKGDVPGECWWTSFGKRHGLLTKSLLAEFGRTKDKDVIIVKEYYSIIESKVEELGLADKPGQIWHIEEHSFCGRKRVSNTDKHKDFTVVTAFNAEGSKAPLLTVFKGEDRREWLLGKQLKVSQSLGMCRDLFKSYFTTIFLNYIDGTCPNLVIYDGQSSHIDISLIDDARKAKITMIKSPSYLEGLDISITKTLKHKWDTETFHADSKEFATVIADIFDKLEVFEIEKDFKDAGVYPFEEVCDRKFDSSRLMVYEEFREFKMSYSLRPEACDEPELVMMMEDAEFQFTLKIEPEEISSIIDIDEEPMFMPEETKTLDTYSHHQLQDAMIAVNKGLTLMEVSSRPTSMLLDEIQTHPARTLTNEEKIQLVAWVIDLSEAGFTVTKANLTDAVVNLVTEFGRVPLKNKMTERNLYKGLLKKHPELADKITRDATDFTEGTVKVWFDRVQTYIKERTSEDVLSDPRRIFNCKEVSLCLSPDENRAIIQNGIKANDDLTVLVTASADGNIQEPCVIFNFKPAGITLKHQRVISWSKADFLCDQIIDVVHPWLLDHEIPFPVILFMDRTTHINTILLEFCKENQIILIALPGPRIQPLETVSNSLKQYWKETQSATQKLKKEEIAKALEYRLYNNLSGEITNGFKMSGLCPFDPNISYDTFGKNGIENQIFGLLDEIEIVT